MSVLGQLLNLLSSILTILLTCPNSDILLCYSNGPFTVITSHSKQSVELNELRQSVDPGEIITPECEAYGADTQRGHQVQSNQGVTHEYEIVATPNPVFSCVPENAVPRGGQSPHLHLHNQEADHEYETMAPLHPLPCIPEGSQGDQTPRLYENQSNQGDNHVYEILPPPSPPLSSIPGPADPQGVQTP